MTDSILTDSAGGFRLTRQDLQDLTNHFDQEVREDLAARKDWEERRETARNLLYPKKEASTLFPGASNVKLQAIPDIIKLRPRFRDAILGDGRDIVVIEPVGEEDILKAQRLTKYMNWELVNEANISRLVDQWIFLTLVDGDGWIKDRHYRTVKRRPVRDQPGIVAPKVIFDGAKPSVISGIDIIVPRGAMPEDTPCDLTHITHVLHWNVFEARGAFERMKRAKRGTLDSDAWDSFLALYDSNNPGGLARRISTPQYALQDSRLLMPEMRANAQTIGIDSTIDSPDRDVWEIHFQFNAKPNDPTIPVQDYIGWFSPDVRKFLAIRETFEPRPFYRMQCYPSDTFYGVGLPMVIEVWLELFASLFNASVNYALVSNLPWGYTTQGAAGGSVKFKVAPGEIATGLPQDVQWPSLPRLDGTFFNLIEHVERIKNRMGASELFAGDSRATAGANAPASSTLAMLEQASVTLGDIGKNMLETFRQFVAGRIKMNRLHITEEKAFRVLGVGQPIFDSISPDDFPDVEPDVVINRNITAAYRSIEKETATIVYNSLAANPIIAQDPNKFYALTKYFLNAHQVQRSDILPDITTQGGQNEQQPAQPGAPGAPGAGVEQIPGLAAGAGASPQAGNNGTAGGGVGPVLPSLG